MLPMMLLLVAAVAAEMMLTPGHMVMGSAVRYSGEQCADTFQFFLNATEASPADLDTAELDVTAYMSFVPPYTTYECAHWLRIAKCVDTFGPYNANDSRQTAPCEDLCSTARTVCDDFLTQLEAASDVGYAVVMEPIEDCATGPAACVSESDVVFSTTEALDEPDCPWPLVVPDTNDPDFLVDGTACATRCPTPQYSPGEVNYLYAYYTTLTTVALFGSVFMVGYYSVRVHKETEPFTRSSYVNLLCASVGFFVLALGLIISAYPSPEEFVCKGNAQSVDRNFPCLFQGYLITCSSLYVGIWCLLVGLELAAVASSRVSKLTIARQWRKYYLPISLTIPAISCCLFAWDDAIGPFRGSFSPFCSFRTDASAWAEFGAFYGLHTAICAVALVFLIIAMYSAALVVHRTADMEVARGGQRGKQAYGQRAAANGVAGGGADCGGYCSAWGSWCAGLGCWETLHKLARRVQKMVLINRRPMTLVFVYIGSVSYVVIFRYHSETHSDNWNESTEDWVTCLLENGIQNPDSASDECGKHPDKRSSVSVVLMAIIAFALVPATTFIVFGLDEILLYLGHGLNKVAHSIHSHSAGKLSQHRENSAGRNNSVDSEHAPRVEMQKPANTSTLMSPKSNEPQMYV